LKIILKQADKFDLLAIILLSRIYLLDLKPDG